MARLTVLPDTEALANAAAGRIASLIEAATVARGAAVLALAGGNTPEPVYQRLADSAPPWRARIDWLRVHLYWSDERNVPPDHPDSNFGLANRTLIQRVPIPAPQVHRMRGELQAVDAAREYDALLRARRSATQGSLFDVMLLGIGADAHIASMFPESPLLNMCAVPDVCGADPFLGRRSGEAAKAAGPECELERPDTVEHSWAAGIWVRQLNQWRITLTPPSLLDSNAIIVLAAGSSKADAIAAAINGDLDVARYPAQLLRDAGDRVEWIVDAAAARLVSL